MIEVVVVVVIITRRSDRSRDQEREKKARATERELAPRADDRYVPASCSTVSGSGASTQAPSLTVEHFLDYNLPLKIIVRTMLQLPRADASRLRRWFPTHSMVVSSATTRDNGLNGQYALPPARISVAREHIVIIVVLLPSQKNCQMPGPISHPGHYLGGCAANECAASKTGE